LLKRCGTQGSRNVNCELQVTDVIDTLPGVNRDRGKPVRIKASGRRSPCPISCTLDVLGDKWTLLVIRDLMWRDKRLYSEFLQSPEGIPTSVLAERLKRLEEAGLITKEAYQHNPVRYAYQLTAAGNALRPLLQSIGVWGAHHIEHAESLPNAWLHAKPQKS
jgi:DNA-binding HxlR family transcriptional regulator